MAKRKRSKRASIRNADFFGGPLYGLEFAVPELYLGRVRSVSGKEVFVTPDERPWTGGLGLGEERPEAPSGASSSPLPGGEPTPAAEPDCVGSSIT